MPTAAEIKDGLKFVASILAVAIGIWAFVIFMLIIFVRT
jgi:hypothetical protein